MPSHIEKATHLLLEQQTKGPANREKKKQCHPLYCRNSTTARPSSVHPEAGAINTLAAGSLANTLSLSPISKFR